jgi:signal transduction histidine kinase
MTAINEPLTGRLLEAVRIVAQTDRPDDAALKLVEHLAKRLRSRDVSLWLLERGETLFVPHASLVPDRWRDRVMDAATLAVPRTVLGSSGRAQRSIRWRDLAHQGDPTIPPRGTLVVGRRVETVIGLILIADRGPDSFEPVEITELEFSAQLLVQIYQREFAYNHLRVSRTALNFRGSEQDFFESLILQIAESARMEFVALREHDEGLGGLRTLDTWGFDESASKRRLDLAPLSKYPAFASALEGKRVVARSREDPAFASLLEIPELKRVNSFVAIPIRVGSDGIFGVLSVAASCEYDYNTLECRAFEGLANSAGLAIRYYRTNHEVVRQVGEFTEISTALTAVEVAQAARHEAIVKIANADLAITNVNTALRRNNVSLASERLQELRTDHEDILAALNKIKLATMPVAAEFAEVPLKRVLEEARHATVGKLTHVHVRIEGPDPKVRAMPDRLRQVFINLFLNSADAFEALAGKAQRRPKEPFEIVVRINPSTRATDPIVFTYRDNAGGIQHNLLPGGEPKRNIPAERMLFEKGVTSKEQGTGFGLWLADRFMQQHAGSIAVLDQRRGTLMFELQLPDPSTVEVVRGRLKPRHAS